VVFLRSKGGQTMEKSFSNKVSWLQHHYAEYSVQWYTEEPKRTEAIYRREFSRFNKVKKIETIKKLKEEKLEEVSNWDQLAEKLFGKKLRALSFKEVQELFSTDLKVS
jgi:tyrosyl-tRNA synthetase